MNKDKENSNKKKLFELIEQPDDDVELVFMASALPQKENKQPLALGIDMPQIAAMLLQGMASQRELTTNEAKKRL